MEQTYGSMQAAEVSMSPVSKFFKIFTEPKKVFQALTQKPTWLVVFLIIAILATTFGYLTYSARMADVKAQITTNPNLNEEQKELILSRMGESDKPNWTMALTPVGLAIYVFFLSGVLFFVFNILLGGSSTFKKMLSVFCYSALVGVPEMIIKTPLILAKKTLKVHTDLALFLPVDWSDSFLYMVLDQIDLFTIWQVVLLGIGTSVIYNFSLKKSLNTIVVLWILLVLISTVVQKLTAGLFFA